MNKRIAWVRQIIGEAAIKRWQQNRTADYVLTQNLGDWESLLSRQVEPEDRGDMSGRPQPEIHQPTTTPDTTRRPYEWKPFALVKIANVLGFLYDKPVPDAETQAQRAAHYQLWGVDILETENIQNRAQHWAQHWAQNWAQQREPRGLDPVRFTPEDLVPAAATGIPQAAGETPDAANTAEHALDDVEIFPPPELPKREKPQPNKACEWAEHKPP